MEILEVMCVSHNVSKHAQKAAQPGEGQEHQQ